MTRLIKEFPWLWGLSQQWNTDSVTCVDVSRRLTDLAVILEKPSSKSVFEIWAYTASVGPRTEVYRTTKGFGWTSLRAYNKHAERTWLEVLVGDTKIDEGIINIASVLKPESGYPYITVFGHPEKKLFNEHLKSRLRLMGKDVQFLPSTAGFGSMD